MQDLRSGKVSITSQNHGYAVDPDSLPKGKVEVTHVNLNDGTCEGIQLVGVGPFLCSTIRRRLLGPTTRDIFSVNLPSCWTG